MLKKTLFFLFFFLLLKFCTAQQFESTAEKYNPYNNPVILNHYSVQDLYMLETTDSVRFNTIVYYYTQSFIIEKLDCSDCIEIDIRYFDVSKAEQFRKPHERYVREADKYGVKLTLLATDELLYKMPIHIQ